MIDWSQEIHNGLIIAGIYISIFLIAEIIQHNFKTPVETTRKFVHLAGGFVALSFGYIFQSHWTVLLLCISFAAIIAITKYTGTLQSVHNVSRESTGGVYYPLAIYITFLFATLLDKPNFYLISILVLSISDTLAALIGSSYGIKLYKVEEDKKSFEGTIIFFLSCFIIVLLGLLLITETGRVETVLAALYIAILVTSFEAISLGGADNLFIPVGTLFILSKITTKPPEEIAWQIALIFLIYILIITITSWKKKLGNTGVIGISLLGYGAWSLVGFPWFIPIVIGTFILTYFDIILEIPDHQDDLYRIRPVFYVLVVPLIWLLIANAHWDVKYIFVSAYIISFTAHFSILWERRLREKKPETPQINIIDRIINNSFSRALILPVIFLIPLLLFSEKPAFLFSYTVCVIGTFFSNRLYWVIYDRKQNEYDRLKLWRVRMLIVLVISALAAIINLNFLFL
jgi:dolichol kinase